LPQSHGGKKNPAGKKYLKAPLEGVTKGEKTNGTRRPPKNPKKETFSAPKRIRPLGPQYGGKSLEEIHCEKTSPKKEKNPENLLRIKGIGDLKPSKSPFTVRLKSWKGKSPKIKFWRLKPALYPIFPRRKGHLSVSLRSNIKLIEN